jgi:hypothetical protein
MQEEQLDALMARLADGERAVFARVFELLWMFKSLRACVRSGRRCRGLGRGERGQSTPCGPLVLALGLRACAGYSGVVGLRLGFVAGMVPGLLRRALRRESP